jgi:hypothetical protein
MEGLIETKNEYIEHMQDIITIPISKKIYEIWCDCSKRKGSIKEFQKELVQIKKWNNNLINEEYKKIVKTTKCKYLADLIKIIIITTIKIKIYEYKDYFDNIKIKIPSPEDFVHKCYINVSIFSWKNAYLFNNKNIKDSEHQNNLNIIEENFKIIIKKTFRDFIPFDDIFQQIKDNLTENVKQTNCDDDKKSSNKKKDIKTTKRKNNSKKEEDSEEDQEDADDTDDDDATEEDTEDADDADDADDAGGTEENSEEDAEENSDEDAEEDSKEDAEEDSKEDAEDTGEDVEEDAGEDVEEDTREDANEDIEHSSDESNADTEPDINVENVKEEENLIFKNNNLNNFLKSDNIIDLNNKEGDGYKNEISKSNKEDLFYKKEEIIQKTKNGAKETLEEESLLPVNIKKELQENKTIIDNEKKYNIFNETSDIKNQEESSKTHEVKEIHIDNTSSAKNKKLKFF